MSKDEGIDAVVFDLGGVLIDVDFRRAFASWATAAGVPIAALPSTFPVDEACCAHERGEIDDRAYLDHVRRSLGLAISDEAMLAGWNAILGEPLPGIEAVVLDLAQRFPLYVFSNTNPAHVAHFTPRLTGLMRHFRKVVTSCELGRRKQEPGAFERLSSLIGVPPQRLLFFDDVEANVAGARRAGVDAHLVRGLADVKAISERLLQKRSAR